MATHKLKYLTFDNPKLLIVKEKHSDYYYLIRSKEELDKVCLQILDERVDANAIENFHYSDLIATEAYSISRDRLEKKAFEFLVNRSPSDYETIQLEDFENFRGE